MMKIFTEYDSRIVSMVLAGALMLCAPSFAIGATKYASPNGSFFASGDNPDRPWDAESCMTRLSPGDTCIYLEGNYGNTVFSPSDNGTRSAPITHRCETRHACRFDRFRFDGNSYLEIVNLASDTNYYDSTKSFSNPRMRVINSHDLVFDSIFVRGEPDRCAPGNPGPGCKSPSEYGRYNDLVKFGDQRGSSGTAWSIEIRGASEFINGNHTVLQFFGDDNSTPCDPEESNFWIHGTERNPIKISSKYHHLVEFKGACNILMEYIDFGPAGNGRSDLLQPTNGDEQQSGGIIHGATMRNIIVRYSNFSMGGAATDQSRNKAHIEIGRFGAEVNGACFAHNSHYRAWGPMVNIGMDDRMKSMRHASIINNASEAGWYMKEFDRSAMTSPYVGYLMVRTGRDGASVDVDGIASDTSSASEGFLYGRFGNRVGFPTGSKEVEGISIGSTIFGSLPSVFRNAANWDFRPRSGSRLIGSAAPIAVTTRAGNGSTVPVNRPECFAGPLGQLRLGDEILIGRNSCRVTATDLARETVTCSSSLTWNAGDEIYYKVGGTAMTDIGSRSPSSVVRDGDQNAKRPKPPLLTSE
jgi:hypothetical protein